MEPKEIAQRIKEKFPLDVQDIARFSDQISVSVKRDKIVDICRYLAEDPEIRMDFLSDLCGVDYPGREFRFEVVYNQRDLRYVRY
jgi:NADH-quinone oxidoreductase subunit C